MNRFEVAVCLVCGCFLCLTGCSGSTKRVKQPVYSSAPGSAAISAYDSNSDGAIAEKEFDSVPGLRASLAQVDTNGDDRITAEEIDDRVNAWKESRIGQMAAICEVTLDGKPLTNAKVVFDPESFVGSDLPSGSGTTGETGMVGISQSETKPGLPPGWYKIRVTSPDREIPARYNSQTTLGCEVATYCHWQNDGAVKLALSSK